MVYMNHAAYEFDNDGWTDLFVAGMNRNIPFRNKGDGTFEEVTAKAGVQNQGRWAVPAGRFDYEVGQRTDFGKRRQVWSAAKAAQGAEQESGLDQRQWFDAIQSRPARIITSARVVESFGLEAIFESVSHPQSLDCCKALMRMWLGTSGVRLLFLAVAGSVHADGCAWLRLPQLVCEAVHLQVGHVV